MHKKATVATLEALIDLCHSQATSGDKRLIHLLIPLNVA